MPKPGMDVAKEVLGDTLAVRLINIRNTINQDEEEGRDARYEPGYMQGVWDAAIVLGLEDQVRRALILKGED